MWRKAQNIGLNQEFNICGLYSTWDHLLGVKKNIPTLFKLTGILECYYCFTAITACFGGMIIIPVLCSLKLHHKILGCKWCFNITNTISTTIKSKPYIHGNHLPEDMGKSSTSNP